MIFIIGAGITGLSIGNKLLSNGFDVHIFDHFIDGEATLAAVGMLAPLIEAKPHEEDLLDLMQESKMLWAEYSRKISTESKIDVGYKENSSILVANDQDEIQKLMFKKKFLNKLGFEIDFLEKKEILRIEPLLSNNIQGGLFCRHQDQVNPIYLKKALQYLFLKKGGKITKKKILKLKIRKNKPYIYLDKDVYESHKIVISAGAWSYKLLDNSFNLSIPIKPIKGVSMRLKVNKRSDKIKHNLWFNNIYVAPRTQGELVVGATEEEKGFNNNIQVGEIYYLTKYLWESLPFTENYEILAFNSGFRPQSLDGAPLIGELDVVSENIICAFGHFRHGILLSPITAKIVLEILKNKKRKELYEKFLPKRFNLKV